MSVATFVQLFLYINVQKCTIMYMKASDIRANWKTVLDEAVIAPVYFERGGITYVLTTTNYWNDKQTQVQKTGATTLITNEVSTAIRPNIPNNEPVYTGIFDTSYRESPEFRQFLKDYSEPGVKPPHPEYGYPCCHKDAPCKHWIWSDGVYKNTLTGKTRDE